MRRYFLLFVLLGALAFGDGAFIWEDVYAELKMADQLAFIFYEKPKETLVLSVNYKGKGENFAWVIPLPSLPNVSLAPENFFEDLGELLARLSHPAYHMGGEMGPAALGGGEAPVSVIFRRLIGNYDVAVLSATDPDALYHWCEKEGYKLPQSAPSVLKPYIDSKWFFVAVKIAVGKEPKRRLVEGSLTPLKIEFNTEEIVYPLRISSMNREYLDPKIGKIDSWMGHKVVFRDEWEKIAGKIIKQAKEERRKRIPFSGTLLHKLGFDELQKSYEKSLNNMMELGDFDALLDMVINDALERLADEETSGLELIVVAPYSVAPGRGTPAEVRDNLKIIFTTDIEPQIFQEYFLDENKNPLFHPQGKMFLTQISGKIPFSFFTGDLYLIKKG